MVSNGPFAFAQSWSKKTWIIIGAAAAAVLIIVIVVPVEVAKENAYPDYTAINYTLTDTYSGSDFFDNFDYFTATGEQSRHGPLLKPHNLNRVPR